MAKVQTVMLQARRFTPWLLALQLGCAQAPSFDDGEDSAAEDPTTGADVGQLDAGLPPSLDSMAPPPRADASTVLDARAPDTGAVRDTGVADATSNTLDARVEDARVEDARVEDAQVEDARAEEPQGEDAQVALEDAGASEDAQVSEEPPPAEPPPAEPPPSEPPPSEPPPSEPPPSEPPPSEPPPSEPSGCRNDRDCSNPCFPIGIAACCRSDGSCGCSWASGAYCL